MKKYAIELANGTCPPWQEFLDARLERAHPTSWSGWYIIQAASYRDAIRRAQKLSAEFDRLDPNFPQPWQLRTDDGRFVIPSARQYNQFHPDVIKRLDGEDTIATAPNYRHTWYNSSCFREGKYHIPNRTGSYCVTEVAL